MSKEGIKKELNNFIDSFSKSKNADVTRYATDRLIETVTKADKYKRNFTSTKISDRKITSDGIK